jgi:hypothetical protein
VHADFTGGVKPLEIVTAAFVGEKQ